MADRTLWSYKDIAAHIQVQPDTVRSYRKHGLLPPARGAPAQFRRPAGPAAALAGLAGSWNGSGARHGGLQAPSGTQRAVLAQAKAALAEIERELRSP